MGPAERLVGYCVDVKPRGERSSLATLLGEDGIVLTTCPRGMGGGKKSFPLQSSLGMLSTFELTRRSPSGPWVCTSFQPVGAPLWESSSLALNSSLMLSSELIQLFFQGGRRKLFDGYTRMVELFSKKLYTAGILDLLIEGIEELGLAPTTRSCADCGAEGKLVAFSLDAGGFLCPECAPSHPRALTGRRMLLSCRYVFETPLKDRETEKLDVEDVKTLALSCIRYLEDYFSERVSTLDLFVSSVYK